MRDASVIWIPLTPTTYELHFTLYRMNGMQCILHACARNKYSNGRKLRNLCTCKQRPQKTFDAFVIMDHSMEINMTQTRICSCIPSLIPHALNGIHTLQLNIQSLTPSLPL